MTIGYLIFGIFLLLVVTVDCLWTTLWVDGGAGPVSARLTIWAWRGVLSMVGHRRDHWLSLFGPFSLVSIVLLWVLLLWTGWAFVFASDPGALIDRSDGTPVNGAQRIVFVTYTIFTLGHGDYSIHGEPWLIVTSIATASGLLLVTLAIAYVLSVPGAVVKKRAFASQVMGLGAGAEMLLVNAWSGKDLRMLDLPLSSLSSDLNTLSTQTRAYPILQYYHADRVEKATVVGLVVLDDALTLLEYGAPEEMRPNRAVLRGTRSAVDGFLDTLTAALVDPAAETPSAPNLSTLRAAGFPTLNEESFQQALVGQRERRRKLLGLLREDGWRWAEWER